MISKGLTAYSGGQGFEAQPSYSDSINGNLSSLCWAVHKEAAQGVHLALSFSKTKKVD